jgi:O-antigen ligase
MGTGLVLRLFRDQGARQIGRNGSIRLRFWGHQALNVVASQSLNQGLAHASRNQHLHILQMGGQTPNQCMEGLIFGHVNTGFLGDRLLGNLINPEALTVARMFRNVGAVLAGNGYFHGVSPQKLWRTEAANIATGR